MTASTKNPTSSASSSQPAAPLEAIRYRRGHLEILDQKRLPALFHYDECNTAEAGFEAIRSMRVRGAPAIAITAALSLAVEAWNVRTSFATKGEALRFLTLRLTRLGESRPTAVNLFEAIARLRGGLLREASLAGNDGTQSATSLIDFYVIAAEDMLEKDVADNRAIGAHGVEALRAIHGNKPLRLLTHCNTGSLATAAYGTALGIIRRAHEVGALEHAYCTETRPYNQGARLTAFELVYEKIPATLVTDSMAAFLMARKEIHGVVVGADRVVENGDTANKIGTYSLAIAAAYHGVPFFVAAPFTSIDVTLRTGAEIPIEERPAEELTDVAGVRIAAPGIGVWNPGFDVTPAALITGIVTERGVFRKAEGKTSFHLSESAHNA